MTWFRVDDGMPSHPKTRSIPRAKRMAAIGVWTSCGAWSSRHLTDGLVPADVVIDEGGRASDAAALVAAGLWHVTGHECDRCAPVPAGHYLFHDWSSPWNPTRERVLDERRATAERVAKHRAKKTKRAGETPPGVSAGNGPGNALVMPPPTRPVGEGRVTREGSPRVVVQFSKRGDQIQDRHSSDARDRDGLDLDRISDNDSPAV